MASIPSPPPSLPESKIAKKATVTAPEPASRPFSIKASTKEDQVFEFHDVHDGAGSVFLQPIIRHYLGVPRARQVFAADIYKILGRLRSLQNTVANYNKGVVSPTPIFLQYWRQWTLNLLSAFGFRISRAEQVIQIPGLEDVIQIIEHTYQDQIEEARDTIKRGFITFEALGELYRPGIPVQAAMGSGDTAAVFLVSESFYQENRGLTGVQRTFNWTMEFVATMGTHFTIVNLSEQLNGWTGVRARSLSELTYTPVSPVELQDFRQRGERYVEFATGGVKYLAHSRASFFRHVRPPRPSHSSLASTSSSQLPSEGRVMVDVDRGALLGHHACQGMDESTLAMTKTAERYWQWRNTSSTKSSAAEVLTLWDAVPDEFISYCWPALVGFSFTAKCWGHVLVSGLSQIRFQDTAFQHLVLAEERKQLIRALVRFGTDTSIEDIVENKRSGSIFLLHGPPGVGKTLTAEAVAEVLHRPLYYVTMGELGTTAEDMEHRLSDVLELCSKWNAITVLDEADVFLEQRRTSDLVRNSMVCVMLRLLEYHSGILFLTTNRVRTLDPAFESRITLALRYKNLEPDARAQIWSNLLKRISLQVATDVVPMVLGQHELNGRQIKSAIRLACAITSDRSQSKLTMEILEEVVRIMDIGRADMADDNSWKLREG
ncbi:AAA family ATPase [Stagonosporopsis vannaccii]|nr:AAA family ATPase [Stagonosporopsis vannaccii]